MEYEVLSHGNPEQKRRLFCLIGEYFASASIRREFERPMSSDEAYTWIVALDGDTVAAFSAIKIAKNGNAELVHAYTFPAYRCQGINRHMGEMRIELAKQLGAKSVHTTIDPARLAKYSGFAPDIQKGKWLVIKKVL